MKFASLPARLWRGGRVVTAQRLPHGLLGPAYFWPGGDPRIRLHRQFWWASGQRWPRPLWLIVETWLWLRWVGWHAAPACWRTVRQLGTMVETEEGIAKSSQAWRIYKLALLWCIPPAASYRFKLYRDAGSALDYVYDHETHAYHAWRSHDLGFTAASCGLLQDKVRFAALMAERGISVVPTLAHVVRDATGPAPLLDCLNKHPRVFCKMNSGNQGRGAFTVWHTQNGLAGRTFTGQSLPSERAVLAAWRQLLELDDALIQPCLENHPDLAPLSFNHDAITVRYISQWCNGGQGQVPTSLSGLCAALEVPAGSDDPGRSYYAILPIQLERGIVGEAIQAWTANLADQCAMARVSAQADALSNLPEWASLIEASHWAHRLFPDVRAIAWDWVLSPDGPVLLEGNISWGLRTPQCMLRSGLLHIRQDDKLRNHSVDMLT